MARSARKLTITRFEPSTLREGFSVDLDGMVIEDIDPIYGARNVTEAAADMLAVLCDLLGIEYDECDECNERD